MSAVNDRHNHRKIDATIRRAEKKARKEARREAKQAAKKREATK
jgi:hypothetical protein